MKINVQLTLKEDFNTLCSIYEIKPEMIIQSFIDQVSFPIFYSKTNENNSWAIYFFLQYLDSDEYQQEIDEDIQDIYLLLFTKVIALSFDRYPDDQLKAETVGRKIMRKWQKVVLAKRSRYLTDNL